MNESTQKSILQMARGAIQERADYEMARILANIMDANTSATVKRKLTLTLELKPDDTRQNISVIWRPRRLRCRPLLTTAKRMPPKRTLKSRKSPRKKSR